MQSKPEMDLAMTETNQNRVFIPTKQATESHTDSHVRIWTQSPVFKTSFSKQNSEHCSNDAPLPIIPLLFKDASKQSSAWLLTIRHHYNLCNVWATHSCAKRHLALVIHQEVKKRLPTSVPKFSLENEGLNAVFNPRWKSIPWENFHDFVAGGGCCQATFRLL
jgi:hypothetical protein